MQRDGLPLLNWKRPVEMHVFPLDRRVGKIRRVCDVLESKHGNDADSYWRTIIRGLGEQLTRSGIPEKSIDQELRAFAEAVQLELRRRSQPSSYPTGDDAA